MSDKQCYIQDEVAAKQAHPVIPPLLKKKLQFSQEELDRTSSIATLHIHIERCTERIMSPHVR